jgi:hypothetical protein
MLVTSSIAPHFALFLCSCLAVVPSSRPARADAPRARAVKAGRRVVPASCSTAARLRLDGPEHGARIRQVGTPIEREKACHLAPVDNDGFGAATAEEVELHAAGVDRPLGCSSRDNLKGDVAA